MGSRINRPWPCSSQACILRRPTNQPTDLPGSRQSIRVVVASCIDGRMDGDWRWAPGGKRFYGTLSDAKHLTSFVNLAPNVNLHSCGDSVYMRGGRHACQAVKQRSIRGSVDCAAVYMYGDDWWSISGQITQFSSTSAIPFRSMHKTAGFRSFVRFA
jgi:hypothetical protein